MSISLRQVPVSCLIALSVHVPREECSKTHKNSAVPGHLDMALLLCQLFMLSHLRIHAPSHQIYGKASP
ncbi:hypothetical protein I79_007936 [Cricetulus griseus]|uniref:Uncharacterized protein n=1 Tax=Cricetulus griseus TaxID=10029 RepID=G3HBN2_CRIGR|nr:hypothetical protein I79_007936 [Cricetulus griseus]